MVVCVCAYVVSRVSRLVCSIFQKEEVREVEIDVQVERTHARFPNVWAHAHTRTRTFNRVHFDAVVRRLLTSSDSVCGIGECAFESLYVRAGEQ